MKVEMGEDGFTVTSEALGLFCLSEKANFAAWWLVDDTIMRDCIPEGQDQPDRLKGDAIEDKGKGVDPLPYWLGDVPDCLWAKGKNDFGRVVSAEPLVVHPKSDSRPHKAQYPLSREAEEGVREVNADLVKRGAIKEIAYSPVNSPIIPVKKAKAPIVHNPITIMASIPAEAKWFSIIDLANAFFSIPRWTWTVMPQGYTEAPSVYGQELGKNLEGFTVPGGSTLVQYVDDLLLCSHTRESCKQDTIAMLDFLAIKIGHKASKEKLQLVSQRVKYLGHVLTSEGRSLGPDRVASIQEMPKPETKQQLLSVPGMIDYCRPWIQDYAQRSQPLV
uniref:ribonuclease H n=1 Tax=Paramormyrops kingsleyae TaxID=1676925 RepID=A0A3B3Q946_9TELE